MNKTKVTTRKGSKSKTTKESPEVFVLPPNLLEKLGIHLGSYGSPSESTEGAQVTDSNLIYKENDSGVNKIACQKDSGLQVTTSSEIGSSIIETAELMKKSVFLSPTFIYNNTSVIQGEIEIVGNAEAEGIEDSAGQKCFNNQCSPKIAEELSIQKEHVSIDTIENQRSHPTSLSTDSIQCDQIANGNVEMNDVLMQTFLDDHADEAYSSDCSNNNMGCTAKADLKPNHTKINIISEQIILPSQIYKLKSNYSPKDNSLIHVSINTMINSQSNIQNNIHQNDSDFITNVAGNIVPTEITVVREGDMLGQHFVEEDFNLPMEDNEILQNINTIDLCTVLNEAESELTITTQNQDDSQQDLKVLNNLHKKDVITKYDVVTDTGISIPCDVDVDNGSKTINKIGENFCTNTKMYSEHSANNCVVPTLKETFKMYNTDSCIDERKDVKVKSETLTNESKSEILADSIKKSVMSCIIEGDNESKNETFKMYYTDSCIDERKDEKVISETMSNESKSEILADNIKKSVMSCGDNESKYTYETKYSHKEINSHAEYITGDRHAYQEVFSSPKEFVTPGQNDTEQPSSLQNGETNSIIIEKARYTTDNKKTNQSVMENQTKSVHSCQRQARANTNINKTKSLGDTVHVKLNKNNPVQKPSTQITNPIFYIRSHKKPVSEKNELVEPMGHGKDQINHENREIKEIKKNDTYSLEGNTLKIGHKNRASVSQEDKVREIAKYLSEFADMKKRNHFINIHTMASSKTLSNKKGTIYSKSSIQGVEKPGGSETKKEVRHSPPSKTYTRRSIQRRKTVPSYVFEESSTSSQSINLTDCSSSNNVPYDMEECLCYDFGRLKSYDNVNSYEHIHFWNSAKTDCTPEILFSIYSENAPSVAADKEVMNVIDEYPGDNSHENPYKLCWNELKLNDENGFEECVLSEESELVQNYLFITEKNISECADSDNVEKKKCNEKQEAEKEAVCQNNKMENANLSQTCERIPNKKIASDEDSSKTRQKRKRSTVIGDDGGPKISKRRISKRLSETQEGYIKPQEEQTTAITLKIYSNNNASPLKAATTLLSESTTFSSEQACTLSTKTSTISGERPESFHDVKVTGQHQAGTCVPVNESTSKAFDQPSTPLNEARNTPEPQTKIPEKVVTTHQLSKKAKGNKTIICGVCQKSVEGADWINHISSQHNYLAWKYGEPCLDVDDETAVREHLYGITKVCGGLTCAKCGLNRKYVKAYLSHVRGCTGSNENLSEIKPGVKSVDFSVKNEGPVNDVLVKCGVCDESIQDTDWNDHRASRHDYLSWKYGEPPLESKNDSTYDVSLEVIAKVESADLTGNAIGEKETASANTVSIICGVCQESVEVKGWNHHIASRHDYLAWKLGDAPLDVNDEDTIRNHLNEITRTCGGLTCAKCGLTRKYVKAYLSHIRRCDRFNESQNDSTCNVSFDEVKITALVNGPLSNSEMANEESVRSTALVKCAVCEEYMQEEDWNSHIAARHDYLAWKLGDTALDVDDETAVRDHLYDITKACGGLTCAKCGLTRKYVKAYLSHVKTCNGPDNSRNDSSCNISTDATLGMESVGLASDSISKVKRENTSIEDALVTCAVCEESVKEIEWYFHIGTRHDYLAWKLDEPSLDINDESAVRNHLYIITNECSGLTCSKCGLTRKYVKAYLNHFKNCNGLSESQNDISMSTEVSGVDLVESSNSSINDVNEEQELLVKCAVCPEYVLEKNWNSHIASRHDYLAWKDGEKCLDVQDEEAVRKHLRHIKRQNGGLKCAKCDTNMKSVKSYLNHVQSCRITISDLEDSSQNLVLESRAPQNEQQVLTSPEAVSSLVKCGVCGQYSEENDWLQHIAVSHEYMAWKDDQQTLNMNDEKEVRIHLQNIVKEVGLLTCPKCDVPHKTAKSYLRHIKTCENQEDMKSSFKCGVCNEVLLSLHWEKHLSEKHDYLAWKDGDAPVNQDDEEAVQEHLYNLSKQFGSLFCNNCGLRRKYVKPYMEHIKICKNGVIPEAAPEEDVDDSVVDLTSGGTCAVCHKEIEAGKWTQHTQKEHNYLAWREGEKPWNLDDFHDLNQYLYVICKRMEGLTCNKCGIVRKYVKTYLTHIKSCDVTDFNLNSSVAEGVGPLNKDEVQCAMCKERLKLSDWKTHAMTQHYNISWIIGETPIDIKNPYAVERYLKEYKQVHGRLKCNACKASRASFAGFYAHIIVCGKTEEEIDVFRSVCDICNNKYLCIYKNQHAMIHRVQDYTAELKIKKNENNIKQIPEPNLSGKRRAAVKARSVIENYSDNMSKHAHACQSCGFGTDFEDELKTHKCEVSNEKDFSGDESSAAEIGSSDNESGDSDVDSNISNEVNDNLVDDDVDGDDDDEDGDGLLIKKKVRHREPAPVLSKVSRIPFKVEDPMSYLRQGDVDFCNTYLTDEVLFPQWQCQMEAVLESDMTRYLPPLEQSCKVKYDSGWRTLNRFEAKKDERGSSMFVGASIVCIAWAPLRLSDIREGSTNYLAVACHNGADCPRYQGDETPKYENLIQIWNFRKFERLPQIVLGIAHDFGTVWSMDWCPSGARDNLPDGEDATRRLGLLAVTCSSGSAYIFAVPYPTEVKNNQFVHKIKPVAELRMTMSFQRKRYQATSVSWSKQKGHALVLVGYADGSTAYYDLHSTSPLLLTVENDVQVFHPYNDERPHNTCITGTDLYPVSGDAAGSGAGVWTAPTGAELAARAGAGTPGRARLATVSLAVEFAPHACCAVLGGDDAIMHTAISELAWVPPGRRLGGIRTMAGCGRCGRVVASTPPILRLMRPHPAYWDAKKQVVGLLEMTHLAKKRKKVNDELGMVVEPLTYEEAITKYGITFKTIRRSDKEMQHESSAKPKAHCPERFPLADVKSMAFCPSRRYHEKLALATHSGLLFLTTIN